MSDCKEYVLQPMGVAWAAHAAYKIIVRTGMVVEHTHTLRYLLVAAARLVLYIVHGADLRLGAFFES